MSRGLRILKRQPGSTSSCRGARLSAVIRKLKQETFATADTPSVKERLNVLAALITEELILAMIAVARIAAWSFAPRLDQTLATRGWLIGLVR
jgi:hypothetical protein